MLEILSMVARFCTLNSRFCGEIREGFIEVALNFAICLLFISYGPSLVAEKPGK